MAQQCRDANEEWKHGRDKSGQNRLRWLAGDGKGKLGFLGALPIEVVDTDQLDKLVKNLAARPAQKGEGKLSKGTINRYLSAVSAVLTFAKSRKRPDGKPLLGMMPEVPPW